MASKQQILAGVRYSEPLYVPELEHDGCGGQHGCDGIVQVRPLSDGEQGEIEVELSVGQVVSREVGRKPEDRKDRKDRPGALRSEIDVAESARGQKRARRIGVAYGLSVGSEEWTPDEVAQLPPSAVRRIMRKVRALTDGKDAPDEGDGEDQPDDEGDEDEDREVGDTPARFRTDGGGPEDRDPAPDRPSPGTDAG